MDHGPSTAYRTLSPLAASNRRHVTRPVVALHAAYRVSEPDLIARVVAGDRIAARELYDAHAPRVFRLAFRLTGDTALAREFTQDTFVRAFHSLEGFRGESSFRTWLFTIERRLLLDRRRAEKRRRDRTEIKEDDAATEYDALDGVVADETQQKLRDAIKQLSPTQREVFTLRVSEGLSYKEIAEAVGTTEGAARVHYHNAMRAVKEFLDE